MMVRISAAAAASMIGLTGYPMRYSTPSRLRISATAAATIAITIAPLPRRRRRSGDARHRDRVGQRGRHQRGLNTPPRRLLMTLDSISQRRAGPLPQFIRVLAKRTIITIEVS